MLNQYHKEIHEQFSGILTTIREYKILESEAPTFSITTGSGASTRDPPFQIHRNQQPSTTSKEQSKEKDPRVKNQAPFRMRKFLDYPLSTIPLNHPVCPFPPDKKTKKDDDEERFRSIIKQIHVNLPFLEAMIHMPKVDKVDFVVLEMDEDKLVPIILRRHFLATARAVIDVHEGKPSLRVKNETVDTIDHDEEWVEAEDGRFSNEVRAVSFYPRAEPVEPLEWKAPENRLKPSSIKPPKLELKELPEHLEYAFLQEDNQLLVVISSALSATKKASLLEVLRNHKGAIA
ncbi:hypothetical protein Tco_0482525 [Tanacetum coccineum]